MNRSKVGILVAAALLGVRTARAETYDAATGFVTTKTAWSTETSVVLQTGPDRVKTRLDVDGGQVKIEL